MFENLGRRETGLGTPFAEKVAETANHENIKKGAWNDLQPSKIVSADSTTPHGLEAHATLLSGVWNDVSEITCRRVPRTNGNRATG